MWCRQQPGVIGVALYQGRLYVCELYQEQTGWSVRHHYNIVLESGEDIEAAAGRLAVHCLQEGMEKDPVIVCLPLEKIFYYIKVIYLWNINIKPHKPLPRNTFE